MKREIVDYMNTGDGTSANGVDWNVSCPCQPAMQRENVDTGSAAIALDSEQLPVPVACAQ